jgi:hypothetical protein
MLSGITQTSVGLVVAGTIGSSVILQPSQKPHQEAVFLERLAARVERTATLPAETRDYLAALTSRYAERPAVKDDELRRQRALRRLADAVAYKSQQR